MRLQIRTQLDQIYISPEPRTHRVRTMGMPRICEIQRRRVSRRAQNSSNLSAVLCSSCARARSSWLPSRFCVRTARTNHSRQEPQHSTATVQRPNRTPAKREEGAGRAEHSAGMCGVSRIGVCTAGGTTHTRVAGGLKCRRLVLCALCCSALLLSECEADGELAGYICAGASETERETRSGCGALVSAKEYKQLKTDAEAKAKKGASSSGNAGSAGKNNSAASAPSVVRTLLPSSAGKPGLGMRRPLPSLHSGGAARSSLHTPTMPAKPAPVVSSTADAIVTPASANHTPTSSASSSSSSSASVQKAAAKPIVAVSKNPAAPGADSGDSSSDNDDEDEGDGEDGSSSDEDDDAAAVAASKPKKSTPVVTSTSTTPTKLPASAASSPARGTKTPTAAKGKKGAKASPVKAVSSPAAASSFNLADASVSRAERERALKKKLAAARAAREAEFAEKYGAEGDADTAEEKANAARKGSGQAGEDFLACSQEGGEIKRAPLVEGLSVKGAVLFTPERKPWTMPRAHGSMSTDAIALVEARAKAQFVVGRRLGARARIFSGAFKGFKTLESESLSPPEQQAPPPPVLKVEEKKVGDTDEPLPIWTPTPEELAMNPDLTPIEVPHLVCKWLRPHQREGVKFMAECVLGLRNLGGAPSPPPAPKFATSGGEEGAEGAPSAPPPPPACTQHAGAGAILADDMGLGKTLQSVGLIYTLLTQGFLRGSPVARKVIIVTPTSLVANWRNEIDKWLGKGVLNVVALSEVGKDNIECGMDTYTAWNSKSHVLIVSYDTFRRYVDRLKKPGLCDLLICDEAHRLKNNKTSTYTALDALPCKRRVLLSGTPMQNDLSEFFSMINFTNRGIIGDRKAFRKYYELPILMGREPECLEEEAATGAERSAELSAIVNQFVLRRTNVLLKKHLPPKVIQIVCVRPSALQVALYQHFLASKSVRSLTTGDDEGSSSRSGGGLQPLPLITSLKKLVNHPKLIYDSATACAKVGAGGKGVCMRDEEGNIEKVPPALVSMFKSMKPIFEKHDGGGFLRNPSAAIYSGKMFVLERLLMQIRASSTDRMVIVSNFTSALDVIATMCTLRKWDYLRLDGTTSIKKRQQLVDQLSDHRGNRVFVFLLSSRAGGCGLNLIGANRLILFDPDVSDTQHTQG